MAYDLFLEERIGRILDSKSIHFEAKKMMGGLCYMIDDKMCVGIVKDRLMARVGPDFYEQALSMKYVNEMDFTKRPMRGYVFVEADGIDIESELEYWIDKCLEYNPFAKSSRKKK